MGVPQRDTWTRLREVGCALSKARRGDVTVLADGRVRLVVEYPSLGDYAEAATQLEALKAVGPYSPCLPAEHLQQVVELTSLSDVALPCSRPVFGNRLLRLMKVQLPGADEEMEPVLQLVLPAGGPAVVTAERLRPQIGVVVGAAEL